MREVALHVFMKPGSYSWREESFWKATASTVLCLMGMTIDFPLRLSVTVRVSPFASFAGSGLELLQMNSMQAVSSE